MLYVFTSKPEHSWGAQLELGKLFLPEPGWHLPLEAAPKGLRSQSNLALLSCGSLPVGLCPVSAKAIIGQRQEASKLKQIKSE